MHPEFGQQETPNYAANHDPQQQDDDTDGNADNEARDVVNEVDQVAVPGIENVVENAIIRPRTSTRPSHPPIWMKDYATHVTNSRHPYSLANYVFYKPIVS